LTADKFDVERLIKSLPNINVSFSYNSVTNQSETYLGNENIEQEIRGIEVSNQVSKIAKIKEVRAKLVDIQRELGKQKGLVMDGRDIGTVVFPNAELKIFMTAAYKIRAKRRFDELVSKGDTTTTFEEVLQNINSRDNDDTSRTEHPLIKANDAIEIDNSAISQMEQLKIALDLAKSKLANQ
ncbi:MAG: cytidylate kinase, partial [Flavobacteriales bacterium CG_4_10_14_0_2_um_filter_32_8]